MLFITGDTHGDYSRFSEAYFPEQAQMTKEDYVIICGDFGIWDTTPQRENRLEELNSRPFTTLFVDGNHENYDLLSLYPIEEWNGGLVHRVKSSILHLMRGQLFTLQGKTFFTMGGASCHDIEDGILEADDPDLRQKVKQLERAGKQFYRINHLSWWAQELPDEEEYATARDTLEHCNWRMDYILTHCAPTGIGVLVVGVGDYHPDRLTAFHQTVYDKATFDCWFCGHYHTEKRVYKNFAMLYHQIVELPD